MKKKKTTNVVPELNALCDVLSYMRTFAATGSANLMYHYFCNPGTGTSHVTYGADDYGKVFCVHFLYITQIGIRHKLSVSTTKPY